jgi:hypothetical protein
MHVILRLIPKTSKFVTYDFGHFYTLPLSAPIVAEPPYVVSTMLRWIWPGASVGRRSSSAPSTVRRGPRSRKTHRQL